MSFTINSYFSGISTLLRKFYQDWFLNESWWFKATPIVDKLLKEQYEDLLNYRFDFSLLRASKDQINEKYQTKTSVLIPPYPSVGPVATSCL